MDNETRLRKAILKARKNNFNFDSFITEHFFDDSEDYGSFAWLEYILNDTMVLQAFLLNPDFLKARFGEELICPNCGENVERLVKEAIGYSDWSVCSHCWCEVDAPTCKFIPAYKYHAHRILDLILKGENPLEYFEKLEEV